MSNQEPSWTEGEFMSLCGVMSNTGWFQIHKSLIVKLGIEPAVLLQFFINFHTGVQKSKYYKWQDGWFFCTTEKVESEIGISRRVQVRLLGILKESGCIEIKKAGLPAKRHVRINPMVLNKIVCDWIENKNLPFHEEEPHDHNRISTEHQTVSSPEHQTVSTYSKTVNSKTEDITLSPAKADDKKCVLSGTKEKGVSGKKKKEPSDFDKRVVKELRKVVEEFRGRECSIRGWADWIRKLREIDKVSEKDIKKAFLWYKKNIGGDFVPEIFCGETFRKKFPKLESAISRDSKPNTKKPEHRDPNEWAYDKKNKKWIEQDLLSKLRGKYTKKFGWRETYKQDQVDEILVEAGMKVGEISWNVMAAG